MKSHPIVVLDNGAHTIKAGVVNDGPPNNSPLLVPNAVVRSKGDRRVYIGHELLECRDYSALHFRIPFEKGLLVDWDAQKAVWDALYEDEITVDLKESSLLITEPYFNLPNIQDVYDQFCFEEYEFQSYHRGCPASFIPSGTLFRQSSDASPPACILVVDSGYSFTHIVPILNGVVVWKAVRRIDVGGKLLTNQLKEIISFRQWNMMEETYVMNQVKEACCYVSNSFDADLETCHANSKNNPIVREYILPDFSVNRHGRVRKSEDIIADSDQILYMNNERFTVPEILFRPSDIGLQQCGIPSAIAGSINSLPEDLQGMFWANIGLIGGNTKFPGFQERLMTELRTLAPIDHEIVLYQSSEPTLEVYNSALAFSQEPNFSEFLLTRAEYQESGSNACRRKFRDWQSDQDSVTTKGRSKAQTIAEATLKARSDRANEKVESPSTRSKGRGAGRGRGRGLTRQRTR